MLPTAHTTAHALGFFRFSCYQNMRETNQIDDALFLPFPRRSSGSRFRLPLSPPEFEHKTRPKNRWSAEGDINLNRGVFGAAYVPSDK